MSGSGEGRPEMDEDGNGGTENRIRAAGGGAGLDERNALRAQVQEITERIGLASATTEDVMLGLSSVLGGYDEGQETPRRDGDQASVESGEVSLSLRSSLFEDSGSEYEGGKAMGKKRALFEIEKKKYDNERTWLLEKINSLEHEKKLLEVDFEREVRRFQDELLRAQNQSRLQIESLVSKQKALEAELPSLRDRLKASKEELRNVTCSAAVYHQLKQITEDQLTLREFVMMQIFEATATQRAQCTALQASLDKEIAARDTEKQRGDELEAKLFESVRRSDQSIKRLEEELSQSQLDLQESKRKFGEVSKEADELREKGQRYDAIRARCDELERDRGAALQQAEYAQTAAKTAASEMEKCKDQLSVAEQQVQVMKVDKDYLQRELDSVKRENQRLQASLEREQEKKREAKSAKEKYKDKLEQLQAETKSEYEEKLQFEVSALKESNRKQIEDMRKIHERISEREIRALRSQLEESKIETERLQMKLKDMQSDYDDIRLELSTKDAGQHALATELRSEVSMKVFQVEQMSTVLEERSRDMRKLSLENEKLEKQIAVLKNDFSLLETNFAKSTAQYEAKLASYEEKLEAVNALELEFDTAIVQHAASSDQGNRTMENIPAAPRRRIQQSVALAHKLIESEREAAKYKLSCQELEKENQQLREKVESLKETMAAAQQPGAYIIDTIHAKESEIMDLREQVKQMNQDLHHEQQRANGAIQTRDRLRQDLETLLDEHKTLRDTIKQLQSTADSLPAAKPEQEKSTTPHEHDLDTSSLLLHEVDAPLAENAQEDVNVHPPFSEALGLDMESPTSDLNQSIRSTSSTSFILHREDDEGIPLPRWYRRLRQPPPPT